MSTDDDLLSAGAKHVEAGQYNLALEIYRQLLANQPSNSQALGLAGAASIGLGEWDQAGRYLQQALAADPGNFTAQDNMGVLLGQQGKLAEAVQCFQRAVALKPNHVPSLLNLASAQHKLGDTDAAIATFKSAARLEPDSLRTHLALVRLLRGTGRPEETLEHLRAVVRLRPEDYSAQFELGTHLLRSGEPREAAVALEEALRLKPDFPEALANLAAARNELGDFQGALMLSNRAIELVPNFAAAHVHRGFAILRMGNFSAAGDALSNALRHAPELAEAHNAMGMLQYQLGNYGSAAGSYRTALEKLGDIPDVLTNLAMALQLDGKFDEAIGCCDRALALQPDFGQAHFNLANISLLRGDFAAGLPEYEWRFRTRDAKPFEPRWPLWDGTSLAGRTIVLCAEQGLGDLLQFVRFAAVVKQADRVLLEAPRAMHTILSGVPGVDGLLDPQAAPAPADCCIPLLSLPYRLGTTVQTIPAAIPYIFPDEKRVDAWRERLAPHAGFRIGIAWQGNPQAKADHLRSIPLAQFAPVARTHGVRLISLQMTHGLEQLAGMDQHWPLVAFTDSLDADGVAFGDTAAIIKNLDLVITSDTSIAHLAGALGVPVWVALCKVPDWRWMLDRSDSPWYPTMRLFRQSVWRQWHTVFEQMAAELAPLVAAKSS